MAALSDGLAAADLFGASKGAYTGAQTARNDIEARAAHFPPPTEALRRHLREVQ